MIPSRFSIAVLLLMLVIGGLQPVFAADDECSDMKKFTAKLTRALSTSAGSAGIRGGTFSVVRAPLGTDTNPTKFEIAYTVSGKTVATASVQKGSELWDRDLYLELTASRDKLDVSWQTGGSGCCVCDYTVTATPRGFVATDKGTSPSYRPQN